MLQLRLLRVLADADLAVQRIKFLLGIGSPPWAHQMAMVTPCSITLSELIHHSLPQRSSEQTWLPARSRLEDLLGVDMSILFAVPISKRTQRSIENRRRSHHRILKPKKNLLMCQNCGSWHEIHTICGECYKKVREETDKIKAKLLTLNPYKGEIPDKETVVAYKGEDSKEFWQGKRIVEMDYERPEWFSSALKRRWRKSLPEPDDAVGSCGTKNIDA